MLSVSGYLTNKDILNTPPFHHALTSALFYLSVGKEQ